MNLRRSVFTLCIVALILAPPLRAQEPQTEAGARASVMKLLLAQNRIADTSRVVADSAELWDRFVRCHQENGLSICAITDEKPVTMVSVKLTAPIYASVFVRNYITMRQRCPLGAVIYPPTIGFMGELSWALRYRDGKWSPFGDGHGIAC